MSEEKKPEAQPDATSVKEESKDNELQVDGAEEVKDAAPDESFGAVPAAVAEATGEAVDKAPAAEPAAGDKTAAAAHNADEAAASQKPADESSGGLAPELAEAAAEVGK